MLLLSGHPCSRALLRLLSDLLSGGGFGGQEDGRARHPFRPQENRVAGPGVATIGLGDHTKIASLPPSTMAT